MLDRSSGPQDEPPTLVWNQSSAFWTCSSLPPLHAFGRRVGWGVVFVSFWPALLPPVLPARWLAREALLSGPGPLPLAACSRVLTSTFTSTKAGGAAGGVPRVACHPRSSLFLGYVGEFFLYYFFLNIRRTEESRVEFLRVLSYVHPLLGI